MAVYQFIPNPVAPFEFQPILDGVTYTAIVTWNVFGRRYYVSVYAQDGTRVVTLPVIGSPNDSDISITAGYFESTMVFRESLQQFQVLP